MAEQHLPAVDRRRFLFGSAVVGAGVLLAGCTSNDSKDDGDNTATKVAANDNAEPGTAVTIGFSCPQADHGWIAAIAKNAPRRPRPTATSRSRPSSRPTTWPSRSPPSRRSSTRR